MSPSIQPLLYLRSTHVQTPWTWTLRTLGSLNLLARLLNIWHTENSTYSKVEISWIPQGLLEYPNIKLQINILLEVNEGALSRMIIQNNRQRLSVTSAVDEETTCLMVGKPSPNCV